MVGGAFLVFYRNFSPPEAFSEIMIKMKKNQTIIPAN